LSGQPRSKSGRPAGTLKETVQQGQQLIWFGKGGPDDRRFQIGNISVAFLRNETAGELKMTFAGNASALGYRPVDEARLNVIVHTKAGASIYSWSIGISIKCADYNQPLAPLVHEVPRDVAANVFNSVGTVEVAERPGAKCTTSNGSELRLSAGGEERDRRPI
jgi:hypothetical protein